MSYCDKYNPDEVFKKFKVIHLPTTFVGLSSHVSLDIEADLESTVYLKTRYDNRLMLISEARALSPDHRAYVITSTDSHNLKIEFTPTNECIARARRNQNLSNQFIMDMRLLRACGSSRCCNNENHTEVARYYISGKYEFPHVAHIPKVLEFGDVFMTTTQQRNIEMRNESSILSVKVQYCKKPGFWVYPTTFVIKPNTTNTISVVIKPMALKVASTLHFKIINPHDEFEDEDSSYLVQNAFHNALEYVIKVSTNVLYHKSPKFYPIESLHKINESLSKFAYMGREVVVNKKKKIKAKSFLEFSKIAARKNTQVDKLTNSKCYCVNLYDGDTYDTKLVKKNITALELIGVTIVPFEVDFQYVVMNTESSEKLKIDNKTKHDIYVDFLVHQHIRYTEARLDDYKIKVNSLSGAEVVLYYSRKDVGTFVGFFEYKINKKYNFKHIFKVEVNVPNLSLKENNLKLGMVTGDFFIMCVPLRIINKYNIDIIYEWEELDPEIPFKVIPKCGTVPSRNFRHCEIIYTGAVSKSRVHTIVFYSCGQAIEVELHVLTRKVSIKFLKPSVAFREIPLNLETIQTATLENASKEMAMFYILEPLFPGITISPMSGSIRPKSLFNFKITIKIACVLEFSIDVIFKINHKETVSLSISGTVLEPKVIIQPKTLNVPRIPCDMITYVPLVIQNLGPLKSYVKVVDENTHYELCDNKCDLEICVAHGIEKRKIDDIYIEGGQVRTLYIKLHDIDRRAYDVYLPIKINNLIGPPDPAHRGPTDLQHYINEFEMLYENSQKIKVKSVNREISSCKMIGVFSKSVLDISEKNFEFNYEPDAENSIPFVITNVSKESIPITIVTAKLKPYFSLEVVSEDVICGTGDQITFDLLPDCEIKMVVSFTPPKMGRFVAVADLYLDKSMSISYHNFTFIGRYMNPEMIPSAYYIILSPAPVDYTFTKFITIQSDGELRTDNLRYTLEPESEYVKIKFYADPSNASNNSFKDCIMSMVKVCISCAKAECRLATLTIINSSGIFCKIMLSYCFTSCPLTLHASFVIDPEQSPYPYYPEQNGSPYSEYMDISVKFLEKWMYQQGFRRELYPVIPDTFHIISPALIVKPGGKTTSINVSFLSFLRRIAGPLVKNIMKTSCTAIDCQEAEVITIHDVYNEIIVLIRSRGGTLGLLQAKYLLRYDQFVVYKDIIKYYEGVEKHFDAELIERRQQFERMNKQLWLDLILQCYKVFVLDSCFIDCRCEDGNPHNVTQMLLDWFNRLIEIQGIKSTFDVLNKQPCFACGYETKLTNLTTDLQNGIAFASATQYFCPFLQKRLKGLCKVTYQNREELIIHNASVIIESWSQLSLYFPIESQDFLNPNYLHMLFLSVHLHIILPMMTPRDTLEFEPPLLRSSSRHISVFTGGQESMVCSYTILNNHHNDFMVEKNVTGTEAGKKTVINVKYTANFTTKQNAVLLFHCYNKTRVFDTYILFLLTGGIGSIEPIKKYKINCPLYKPSKMDILVSSPFNVDSIYHMYITEEEPTMPVIFEEHTQPKFLVRRVNLIERDVVLIGTPMEPPNDSQEQRVVLSIICTSTRISNTWIWFCGAVGEFYVKITTFPKTETPTDTLYAKFARWPVKSCSCGEECECYRTGILSIPYRNHNMKHSLRSALLEHGSPTMLQVFDNFFETSTGRLLISMLLEEDGTNMLEVAHILKKQVKYNVTSKLLFVKEPTVTLQQHMEGEHTLIVTLPITELTPERLSLTFTSDDGIDVRTYRLIVYQEDQITV